jgi:hypothetical protein
MVNVSCAGQNFKLVADMADQLIKRVRDQANGKISASGSDASMMAVLGFPGFLRFSMSCDGSCCWGKDTCIHILIGAVVLVSTQLIRAKGAATQCGQGMGCPKDKHDQVRLDA